MPTTEPTKAPNRNVLGQPLDVCGCQPMTGFYRTGCCETGPNDLGVHTICCVVTEDFLRVSRELGNDLSTPMPQYSFPGLKAGDRWCLVAMRWQQALNDGMAPQVVLAACHEACLEHVNLDDLKRYAIDG
jgi:uncharacterized protein (DUF2237 family)